MSIGKAVLLLLLLGLMQLIVMELSRKSGGVFETIRRTVS